MYDKVIVKFNHIDRMCRIEFYEGSKIIEVIENTNKHSAYDTAANVAKTMAKVGWIEADAYRDSIYLSMVFMPRY